MKKTFFLSLILSVTGLTYAQQAVVLPENYAVYMEKNRLGRQFIYTLDSENSRVEVNLKKGDYVIDNGGQYIECSINDNGQLDGRAQYSLKRKPDIAIALFYENGILTKSKTTFLSTGNCYSEIELKDSVQTTNLFYSSGKIRETEITYFNLNDASVNIIYYENGNLESESNTIEKTTKFYFENGTLARFIDDLNGKDIDYNEDGTIRGQWYKTKDGSCKEYFSHEVLISKSCSNEEENIDYYYKNGKLSYYKVYNQLTGNTETFDAKGKKITTNSSTTIISK